MDAWGPAWRSRRHSGRARPRSVGGSVGSRRTRWWFAARCAGSTRVFWNSAIPTASSSRLSRRPARCRRPWSGRSLPSLRSMRCAASTPSPFPRRPRDSRATSSRRRWATGWSARKADGSGTRRPGLQGAGTVHHVAFRVQDDTAQLGWLEKLQRSGLGVSPVMDRSYFHSIYYREPGGVLFEIATDSPGFATDEPAESLGERLMLPRQYEAQRAQ